MTPGSGCFARSEPVLTMPAPPWAAMPGMSARHILTQPIRLTSKLRAQRLTNGAFFIDCDLTPGIDASDIFPCVGRPCLIPELSWTRHRMEGPEQLSGQHVVCPDISW